MCGRYTLTPSLNVILEHYALEDEIASYSARYNIAPSQNVSVVRLADDSKKWKLLPMYWGLIPHWAKDKKVGYKMINAKAETLSEKPSYRTPFKKHRCLIPASGFYEWKPDGNRKQPYYIRLKGTDLLSFAGLWEHWEGDEVIESCTIITTDANETMQPIHNRMPAIIDPSDYATWMNPATPKQTLRELLHPYTAHPMEAFPVSTLVNKPSHDDPTCIIPLH